jgi:hypothetical protein
MKLIIVQSTFSNCFGYLFNGRLLFLAIFRFYLVQNIREASCKLKCPDDFSILELLPVLEKTNSIVEFIADD